MCLRQNKCKSGACQVFFAGVAQIFLILRGLLRQCETEVKKRTRRAPIVPARAGFVKSFLQQCSKFFIIREVPATGSKIGENWRKCAKIT